MESTHCRYVSWRSTFRLNFRGERKLLPEWEQRDFDQGLDHWRGRRQIPALAPEGKELLYLARKKWPTIADDFQLLDQLEGWLSVERQQSEETLQELLLSTVVEWLKDDLAEKAKEPASPKWTEPPPTPLNQLPQLPTGQEWHIDERGVPCKRMTAEAFATHMGESRRKIDEQESKLSFGELDKLRPVYALRKGCALKAPPEVVAAVRTVINDWDGENWTAVRHCLKIAMPELTTAELDRWTLGDIRTRFALGQSRMKIAIGGTANTTDATITPNEFGTVAISPVAEHTSGAGEATSQSVVEVSAGKTTSGRAAKQKAGGRNPKLKLTPEEKQVKELWKDGKGGFTRHNQLDDYLDQDAGYVKKLLDNIKTWERRKRARSTKSTK